MDEEKTTKEFLELMYSKIYDKFLLKLKEEAGTEFVEKVEGLLETGVVTPACFNTFCKEKGINVKPVSRPATTTTTTTRCSGCSR